MKHIEDMFKPITERDFVQIIDINMDVEVFRCPRCGESIRSTQTYINERQKDEFELMVKHYNSMMVSIEEAIVSIYGEDIKMVALAKKVAEIRKDFEKPKLKIVQK